jgi:hypothetical protein
MDYCENFREELTSEFRMSKKQSFGGDRWCRSTPCVKCRFYRELTEEDMIAEIVNHQRQRRSSLGIKFECPTPDIKILAGCEDCPYWENCDNEKVRIG